MVNPMPTPRHSTSGSTSQPGLHFPPQISLAGLSDSVYPAPTTIDTRSPLVSTQTPSPFPPAPSPPSNTVPATKKPRRAQRSHAKEEPIGYVYADKSKFKCNKCECKDLHFGRMADLRRHYEQTHSKNRVQYFCSVNGCSRSHASTGGRGRSFGTRKDKRDEHERNVHKKERESSCSSTENT
ncbi:hypothetical protein P171DRAFT_443419 [Karstenula rhodostoma CBS 690.94]|uniref:Uncharacterized protein n=1 Tax=Karstenula rhodostoma CBS 690.94 TaxID=1392251 RepID=A0A9P4UBP4_9PLEO|nr:hypothetical protein P171DRAFT_443419 [Karstenula rhodostoma CBS 690.94]